MCAIKEKIKGQQKVLVDMNSKASFHPLELCAIKEKIKGQQKVLLDSTLKLPFIHWRCVQEECTSLNGGSHG